MLNHSMIITQQQENDDDMKLSKTMEMYSHSFLVERDAKLVGWPMSQLLPLHRHTLCVGKLLFDPLNLTDDKSKSRVTNNRTLWYCN